MTPFNYSLDVQTPFQAALQGYQAGAAIRNDQAQQQQQQAALAQQQQQQEVLKKLIANPSPTADDYAAATLLVPGMKEQFKQSWDMRSSAQQQNDLQHVGQVYSAIVSGNPQIASDLLKRRADAMRNSGDDAGAKDAEAMAGVISEHPQFARSLIGMRLSAMPGGDKVIGNVAALNTDQRAQDQAPGALRKVNADASAAEADATKKAVDAKYAEQQAKDEIAKRAADLGLTKAQTSQAVALTSKYDAETRETLMKLQQIGKPTPQQQFEAESKLRGEYTKATEGYTGVTEAYRRLKASNNDAAGDLSLIFSYMKMLDPGSVVREGEFATAQNAAGVPDRVRNIFNRLLEGQRLTEGQRKQFTGQAESLYTAAQKRESEARAGLSKVARNYGLNAENIFGGRASEQPGGTPNPDRPPIGQFDLTEGR